MNFRIWLEYQAMSMFQGSLAPSADARGGEDIDQSLIYYDLGVRPSEDLIQQLLNKIESHPKVAKQIPHQRIEKDGRTILGINRQALNDITILDLLKPLKAELA